MANSTLTCPGDGILYVSQGGAGNKDGTSWVNAMATLQDALVVTNACDIWVAAGTYYPDQGNNVIDSDRAATFQLKNNVIIYGGFAGTETTLNERDWETNITILSGDIDNNDTASGHTVDENGVLTVSTGIAGANSYHVVTGSGVDATAKLDGVTISGGSADEHPNNTGGGMYTHSGSPTLTNIIFSANSAGSGGGISNNNSRPTLNNVTFFANSASSNGGGMYNISNSSVQLTNVTFSNNSAGNGGGIHNSYYSHAELTNVSFFNNFASANGGGLYNYYNNNPTLTNVTFSNNTASSNGGGIYNHHNSHPKLENATFSANSAANGGGIHTSLNSSPELTNVTFSTNSASSDGGGIYIESGSIDLKNATFSANSAANGGGIYNSSNLVLTGVTFFANSASSDGGGMYNYFRSPTLKHVLIWNSVDQTGTNTASASIYSNNGTPYISNSLIAGSGGSANWSNNIGRDQGNNLDVDPQLGPLADNGGATHTHALLAGSPAIDAGSTDCDVTTDQRGVDRPQGRTCDIGSFEVELFCPEGGVLYVKQGGAGNNDGTSWANAMATLQDALPVTNACNIWVAAGTYYPDQGRSTTDNDRTATFQLENDVTIYGGFAGTETALNERDWENNITILSGDIDDNDTASGYEIAGNGTLTVTTGIVGNNSYHVVTGSGVTNTAKLDGVTISGGSATGDSPDSSGGGMFNDNGSPTLTNVTFSANSAKYNGGGMRNQYNSNPILNNVTFSANLTQSGYGGGMDNQYSNPVLTNVTFSANSASVSGGGMFNSHSNPTLKNSTFSSNSAANGGGMYNQDSSDPVLTNITFSANSVTSYGGGMGNQGSDPVLTNVTFSANSADNGGGMFNSSNSNPTLNHVTFSANSVGYYGGGAMYNYNNGNPTLKHVLIWGNLDGNSTNTPFASILNYNSTPTISYSLIAESGGSGASWHNAMGTDSGNNLDIDPLLGSLADNGGSTQTIALLSGSPAIDAGDTSCSVDRDQRGIERPQGEKCDIGAFEAQQQRPPVTHIVSTLQDVENGDFSHGDLSLREAVANASDGDSITFDATLSNGTITLNGSHLVIDHSIKLLADIPIQISAGQQSRVFYVDGNGHTVTIDGLTIQDGQFAGNGGGIFVAGGNTLLVLNSTFVGNSADHGGAIYYEATAEVSIQNSTLSGNSASTDGGATYGRGTAAIQNSTISNHTSTHAVVNNGGTLTINHTLIANQASGTNCAGTITSTGYNLDNDGSCLATPTTGDKPNISPQLGSFGNNGGNTQTHALLSSSPAIDAGSQTCLVTSDQRGVARPIGMRCDIGAYEAPLSPTSRTVTSDGPLDRIFAGASFQFQVAHTEDGNTFQFYPPSSTGGAAGTLLTTEGTLYYPGPLPAASLNATQFTVVSQSPVLGSGTSADPYYVITIADVYTTGLRLIQTDSYIPGEEAIRTDIQVSNSSDAEKSFTLYRAADCYLGSSDFGYGSVNPSVGLVSCTKTANNNPAGRVLQFIPITDGSTYYQAFYGEIWSWINSQQPFPNTCRCDEYLDNGMGISWQKTIAPGEQLVFSHITTLSPNGALPLLMSKSADQPTSSPGTQNGYTITVTNPNLTPVTLESIIETLPSGFTYVSNSTSGALSTNPSINGTVLTWGDAVEVPANGSLSLHFHVTVSNDPGQYTSSSNAVATGYDISAVQNAAPITVEVTVVTVPSGFDVGRDGFGFADFSGDASADFTANDVAAMFGESQACASVVNGVCNLRFGAKIWLNYVNNAMRGGRSAGMIATAMRFLGDVDQPANYQVGTLSVGQLDLENIRRQIAYQFALQAVNPAMAAQTADRQRTPEQVLQQLYLNLSDSNGDTLGLALWRSDYRAGHALLPYAIEDMGSGITRVNVYDPNHPGDASRYVEFDTNNNTWRYDLGQNSQVWDGHALSRSIAVIRLSTLTQPVECPWCTPTTRSNTNDASNQIMLDGDADLLITDAENRRLGYVDGQFVNEMPDATASIMLAGPNAEAEPIYTVPAANSFEIEIVGSGATETPATISQVGRGWSAEVSGLSVSEDSTGAVSLSEDGTEMTLSSDSSQEATLRLATESGWQFTLSNVSVEAGESFGLRRDADENNLVIDAPEGNDNTYDIEIQNMDSDTNRTFVYRDVSASEGDTQQFDLDSWNDSGEMVVCSDETTCNTVESEPNLIVSTLEDVENGNYDNDDNSLREAIANARDGDIITFNAAVGGGTITLNGSQLTIDKSITIQSGTPIHVSANNLSRVVEITNGAHVTLDGLTIRDGNNSGISIQAGTELTLTNSTVMNSSATNGGGISNSGTVTVLNSTLSGNSATNDGGGLFNSGTATVSSSTLSGNSAANGGGIFNSGTITVSNSVVAKQTSGSDCSGSIVSGGHNIDSDGSCGLSGTEDQSSTDPLLNPLADDGSNIFTHVPAANSPAVNTGGVCAVVADQRGAPRDANCDIGAVELQSADSQTVIHNLTEPNVEMTFGSTDATLQWTETSPGNVKITKSAEPDTDVNRIPLIWAIDADIEEGLNVQLTLCYEQSDLNETLAPQEANLVVYHRHQPADPFEQLATTIDTEANCVTATVTQFSEFVISTADPTAVTLESFTARVDEAGIVTIDWETAHEVNHAGFNLYRREAGTRTAWLPINDELIASHGTQAQGSVYQFIDTNAPTGHWQYLLEDVETDGDTHQHLDHLTSIQVGSPTAVTLSDTGITQTASTLFWLISTLLFVTTVGFVHVRHKRRYLIG